MTNSTKFILKSVNHVVFAPRCHVTPSPINQTKQLFITAMLLKLCLFFVCFFVFVVLFVCFIVCFCLFFYLFFANFTLVRLTCMTLKLRVFIGNYLYAFSFFSDLIFMKMLGLGEIGSRDHLVPRDVLQKYRY